MIGILVFTPLSLLIGILCVRRPENGWRVSVVDAALIWGSGVLLSSELLSVFGALRFLPVSLFWITANSVLFVVLWRSCSGSRLSLKWTLPASWFERTLA